MHFDHGFPFTLLPDLAPPHPPTSYSFIFFKNPWSTVDVAHTFWDMQPSTGAWPTHQGTSVLNKTVSPSSSNYQLPIAPQLEVGSHMHPSPV